jgi:soluble lytic murein transglycosylase-like protein
MRNHVNLKTAALLCALALIGSAAFAAGASARVDTSTQERVTLDGASVPEGALGHSVRLTSARVRYQGISIGARKLNLGDRIVPVARLGQDPSDVVAEAGELRDAVERAERRRKRLGGLPADAFTSDAVLGVPRSVLDAIASCESGGNPRAVNAAGYYGKYQFSPPTWSAVGGSGNPADASELEQDYRAALLYNRSGPGQWPVCGL